VVGTPSGPTDPVAPGLDAFSLADPATVDGILEAAGFAHVAFTEVHEPVFYGRDVAAALAWVGGYASTKQALERLDAAGVKRAHERLRESFAAHALDDGVWFDSAAWIVQAGVRRAA